MLDCFCQLIKKNYLCVHCVVWKTITSTITTNTNIITNIITAASKLHEIILKIQKGNLNIKILDLTLE